VDRSAVQWLKLKINPQDGSLTVVDHNRVWDSAHTTNAWWYYVPSLMVNNAGAMVAGFSGSSVSNYIGAYYIWRLPCGSELESPAEIQAGTTNYNPTAIGQYGDYSATTLDPSEDGDFWTVQAYAAPSNSALSPHRWATVIVRIRPGP
jgi:hypothetical protein